MRFWDSSALLPLYVDQPRSSAVRKLYADGTDLVVWALSDVEVRSGLCRLARERAVSDAAVPDIVASFEQLWRHLNVIAELDAVRLRAKRLLHVHALRVADSLQLAAALVAAEDEARAMQFATLDERLAVAARLEGFAVVP